MTDLASNPLSTATAGSEDPRPAISTPENGKNLTPQFSFTDLREWIEQADKLGEIRRVNGASWQEDIGMAAEIVQHSETAPCIVFDEIPGCTKGFRVLTNFFGGKRKNMTLGFPSNLAKLELSEAFLNSYLKDLKAIPFEEVSDGPIFENILTGDEVDVTKFPVP